jgi:hypothetical protein
METSISKVPSFEPALPRLVTASPEEIRYAEELRRRLEQRYLMRREVPDPYWCIGVE